MSCVSSESFLQSLYIGEVQGMRLISQSEGKQFTFRSGYGGCGLRKGGGWVWGRRGLSLRKEGAGFKEGGGWVWGRRGLGLRKEGAEFKEGGGWV